MTDNTLRVQVYHKDMRAWSKSHIQHMSLEGLKELNKGNYQTGFILTNSDLYGKEFPESIIRF